MKVILLENVKRVGSIGEVIDVKRGYARNFLIANKKALYASKENILEVEKIKTDLSKKDNEKKKEAIQVSEQINGKEYSVKKLSTENNELYGSVKPTEIAKLMQEKNKIDIKPSMIQPVEEIKSLGKFKVKISLHSEVDAEITISVSSADTIQ
ncbi:ribosomal protein L9 [Candidatus Pelagibacter sp. HTCC7211]|jgi:large subunit ribosomal protein L9|uniref:50S ribosomal protein L9 n=1 Tax=Pelagibacter sp. (strain HTCC7211) TaxID=439493 RepID=UPI0001839E8F|nr:50S ribosomal protein L9 [Candidatus Pelagibacter sp. HTCC7211]EDZ60671.1 ribosomal protein L9 [Candidatus Pelagibacter sp. HTCC7211]MBD1151072.1 50S ribosomal protein L9 [Pelagibacterales bacterium SAG-MED25]